MIQYLCDRCGKIMANDDGLIAKIRIITYDRVDQYDLCRSCKFKIQGWLENAKDTDKGKAAGAE